MNDEVRSKSAARLAQTGVGFWHSTFVLGRTHYRVRISTYRPTDRYEFCNIKTAFAQLKF